MRTVLTALVACLAWLSAIQLGHADEKEEKERREKLEKELAEWEPALAKEEWAVRRKQFIAEMAKHLDKADRIDLFRLNPTRPPEENKQGKKEFHGYEILSEVRALAKEQRQEAAGFLGKTLHWNDLRMALCFNPRHGMRLMSGKQTLDFLICFECNRVRIFDGDEQLAEIAMAFTDPKNPIEKLFAPNDPVR